MEKAQLLFIINPLFLLILIVFTIPAFASEDVESVSAWINQNQCQQNQYVEDAEQLNNNAHIQVKNLFTELESNKNLTCSGVTTQALKTQVLNNDWHIDDHSNDKNSVFIFVSLSMPIESLKSLYKEAYSKGIPLIIRGLKNNSFKDTAEAIKALEISVQIDPNLFEKYEIKTVPTFIANHHNEVLQIKGNVSLSYAEKKFGETYE